MDNKTLTRRAFLKAMMLTAGALLYPYNLMALDAETTNTVDQVSKPNTIVLSGATDHRILTANILLDSTAHHGTPFEWEPRKQYVLKVLKDQHADIICTQEVLRGQYDYLAANLPEYQSFGFAGPEMDARPGDYQGVTKNVIFFRKDRYDMISAGTYWLSETPLIGASQSWDAARGRHANWVRLKDRKSGHEFRVIDTHFDHKGVKARVEQAKIIATESAQYSQNFPQLLAGDFNIDMRNPAYNELLDGGWRDTWTALHGPKDPGNTYHKMVGAKHKSKSGKIDFIFYRGDVIPKGSEIVKDNDNGRYPSDHYFVWADVSL